MRTHGHPNGENGAKNPAKPGETALEIWRNRGEVLRIMGDYLGKTAKNSDPITGEWHGGKQRLERLGIPYMIIERVDTRHRKKPNPVAPPLKIHRNEVQGHLGGQVFTSKMLRFLDGDDGDAKPNVPSLTYAEKHWWVGEHAEREMRAYFPRDAVDVVLGVLRDGQEWGDALRLTDRGIAEVKVLMRAMKRHCRAVIRQQYAAAA